MSICRNESVQVKTSQDRSSQVKATSQVKSECLKRKHLLPFGRHRALWPPPRAQMGCCNTKNDALDTRDVTLEPKDGGGVTDPKTSAASADSAKAQDGNASQPAGEPPAAAETVTAMDSTRRWRRRSRPTPPSPTSGARWQPSNRCPTLAPVAAPGVTCPPLCARRLESSGLDDSARQAVRAAWRDRLAQDEDGHYNLIL